MFPAVGVNAPPVPPVRVSTGPLGPVERSTQTPRPAYSKTDEVVVFTQARPTL